jgi:hypothetical protein
MRCRSASRVPRAIVAAALVASVVPSAARAQDRPAERRGALTLGAGFGGALANTLSGHCGTTASLGASVGVRWRVGRIAFVDGTASRAEGVSTNDCLFGGPFETSPGEVRSTAYARDPDDGMVATAFRAGVEGGGGPVRLRALGGVGRMWHPGVTFATAGASASVGPRAARLLVEFEGWWYRLPVVDRVGRRESGEIVPVSSTRRRVGERTAFLRLGLDVPVGPRQ